MAIKNKGIWFYGLAGSGKTYASSIVASKIDRPFIIDGDAVRKYVSADLGYTLGDRCIQIRRIFGISLIAIKNGYFPIASSVLMNEIILKMCKDHLIDVVEIQRPNNQLYIHRDIYKNNDHVVGKDIIQEQLDTMKLSNDGGEKFRQEILRNVE